MSEEKHISYGSGATFIPKCVTCGRYVKADLSIKYNDIEGLSDKPNCTCSKCGRSKMLFQGFI